MVIANDNVYHQAQTTSGFLLAVKRHIRLPTLPAYRKSRKDSRGRGYSQSAGCSVIRHLGIVPGSGKRFPVSIREEELGVAIRELMVEATDTGQSVNNREKSDAKIQAPQLALRADGGTTFQRLREVAGILRVSGVDQIELLTTYSPADTESD